VNAATKKIVPVWLGYAVMRHFHAPSSGIMVPTMSVLHMLERRGLKNLRPWTHGVDTALFRFQPQVQDWETLGQLPRPLALFVGRVSYEKNIAAFLDMAFPGSKVVCGVGPVEAQLKQRYPHVHWVGLLPRDRLAGLYAAADVFVFPSHADTFGLVMVEAMAAGTPVAAFPVDGPIEVLGRRDAAGRTLGGAMHEDLRQACQAALAVPRAEARARALDFSWAHAARVFEGHLVPAQLNRTAPAGIEGQWT
jgi:glycosyltransferase involved in cell wall biosynthesis